MTEIVAKLTRLHRALESIMLLSDVGRDRTFDQASQDLYACHAYARNALREEFPLPREWSEETGETA